MGEQLLKLAEVSKATSLGRTAIYAALKAKTFPKPVKVTANGRRVAWMASEILAWIAARVTERNAA